MKIVKTVAMASSKQIFDVAKPGKSAPSATSRPVIRNHGPMLKDPMVAQPKDEPTEPSNKPLTTSGEKVIAPLTDAKSTPPAETPPVEDSAQTAATEKAAEEIPKPETSPTEPAIEELSPDAQNKKTTAEDTAHQAELTKLVEEKKYFLPINQVTHRRHRRWSVVLGILILVIIPVAYLAVDANLLDLNIKLPYEFIK